MGAWAASPLGAGTDGDTVQGRGFTDQTVRNVVHLNAGGREIRLELSNAFGEQPLDVGAVTVAVRTSGGAIDETTLRDVRFGGRAQAVIPEGALLVSDPVAMDVSAGTDLAVSIHLPGPTGPTTWHQNAAATSYLSEVGDHTSDGDGAAYSEVGSWFYLTEVAVHGSDSRGAVVAFGDSITEGYKTTTDANQRYSDHLNARFQDGPDGLRMTVLNAGIGGNRLLTNSLGVPRSHQSAQTRFVRDVVGRTGVTTVIATFGTNDLASYGGNAHGDPATADDLIRGMKNLIAQAHAHDLRIMVGTIAPFRGNSIYSDRTERVRQDYNTWVRHSGEPGAVADFDAALRDPDDPTRMLPSKDSGDHVHPSDLGQQAIAQAIDLRWLQGRGDQQPTGEDYLVLGGLQAPQPLNGGVEEEVAVPVTNELSEPTEITVRVTAPEGWSSEPVHVTLRPGEDSVARVPVTAPSIPTTATLTATAEAGSALVIGRPELDVITVPAPEEAALALDFGGLDSPVLTGYQPLTPEDAYADGGVGWVDGTPDWRDREHGDDLRRDFVSSGQPATLRLSVPAGSHTVQMLSGDADYASGKLAVSEGSTPLADTGSKLSAGEFRWLTFTVDGGSTGDTVDLTFAVEGDGTWRANALAVMN